MSSVAGLWNQSQGLWNPGIVAEQMKEKFEALYEQLEQTQSKEERQMVDQMFESVVSGTDPANIKKISLIMIVFESMTLFAAYLMWNLEKRGFYLYLAAIGVTLVAPMLLVGGILGFIMALSGTFFSFFMCLFYAAHLKYMH